MTADHNDYDLAIESDVNRMLIAAKPDIFIHKIIYQFQAKEHGWEKNDKDKNFVKVELDPSDPTQTKNFHIDN